MKRGSSLFKSLIKPTASFLVLTFFMMPLGSAAQDASAGSFSMQSQYLYSPEEMKVYTLNPGDEVAFSVIVGDNAKTLNYKFIITPMGEVFIPSVGVIEIMGLSIKDAKAKIDAEIRKHFKEKFRSYLVLVQPKITRLRMEGDAISIPYTQRYVYVYGEVSGPGRFAYLPGSNLSDYLNFAGGPTRRANLGGVEVVRNEKGTPEVFKVNANDLVYKGVRDHDIEIKTGDIIKVPPNFFYFDDFASFANTIMLGMTLFYTVQNFIKTR